METKENQLAIGNANLVAEQFNSFKKNIFKLLRLLIFLYTPLFSQTEQNRPNLFDSVSASGKERFKIQRYLELNMGRKVGNGKSITLIDSAFAKYFKGNFFELFDWRGTWDLGQAFVWLPDAQYGDVLVIYNPKTKKYTFSFMRQVIDDTTFYVIQQYKDTVRLKKIIAQEGYEYILLPLIPQEQLARAYKTILQEQVFVKKEKENKKYIEKPGASEEEYKIIQAYLKKNMNRRVGDGICHTLVDSALKMYFGGDFWEMIKYRRSYNLGAGIVDIKDARFGDIIIYNDAKVFWSDSLMNHIGFIRKVEGDSIYYVVEQNPRPVEIHKWYVDEFIEGNIIVMRLPPRAEMEKTWEIVLQKKELEKSRKILEEYRKNQGSSIVLTSKN